ncbi:MAG: hypothetical protein ACXVB0_09025 [Mucilaginibacter sp.]
MKKLLVFSICILIYAPKVSAQQSNDCDKLLKKDLDTENPEQILKNIRRTECFGLDSIDLKVFGNGPVLGSLMVKYATDHHDKVTYGDLLSEINKERRDNSYAAMRNEIIAMSTLEATKASQDTWENSRKLLKILQISDTNIDKLHRFMLDNPNKGWNYRQLIVIYEQKFGEKVL